MDGGVKDGADALARGRERRDAVAAEAGEHVARDEGDGVAAGVLGRAREDVVHREHVARELAHRVRLLLRVRARRRRPRVLALDERTPQRPHLLLGAR